MPLTKITWFGRTNLVRASGRKPEAVASGAASSLQRPRWVIGWPESDARSALRSSGACPLDIVSRFESVRESAQRGCVRNDSITTVRFGCGVPVAHVLPASLSVPASSQHGSGVPSSDRLVE
jgi:hypothetical protein